MLAKKVAELLNDQVNKELYSAYLYLDISNYYKQENLDGFANWFKIQAKEERDHAMAFVGYLQQNEIPVTLKAIDKPDKQYHAFGDPLKEVVKHEEYVTSLIHNLYDAACGEKDFRTMQFLSWFVKEQGEEEDNANTLVKKFELFGSDAKGLYMLDAELGAREYAVASILKSGD